MEGRDRKREGMPSLFLSHSISLSLTKGIFLVVQLPSQLSGTLSLFLGTAPTSTPQYFQPSMSPRSYDSLKIQPLTPDNLSSRVALETHVIGTNVASWQVIFNCPARANASLVSKLEWGLKSSCSGKFWGHLGGSRVGLPSCSDTMPRVS